MRKELKRSLISSAVAVAVCASSFAGTTFAWFTDTVTSGNNVIKAGKLEVGAYAYALNAEGDTTITIENKDYSLDCTFDFGKNNRTSIEGSTDIISASNIEPGYSNAVLVELENTGSLNAKVKLDFFTEDSGLQNALWFDFITVEKSGTGFTASGTFQQQPMSYLNQLAEATERTVAAGESSYAVFAYGMYDTAGNEYMGKSFSASVTMLVTQATGDKDGFGNGDYDADAGWPDDSQKPETPESKVQVTFSPGVLNEALVTGIPDNREVTSGGTTAEPSANPTSDGYTFTGWSTEVSGGTLFDFNAEITENTVLYAQWENNASSVTVAAVGDSLTATQNWSGYHPYTYYLSNELGSTYTVSNYGVSGATVTDLLDQREGYSNGSSTSRQYKQLTQYNTSISAAPDIAVIMLGTNDAQDKGNGVNWDGYSSQTYKSELTNLISSYNDAGTNVILVTSPHVINDNATLYDFDVVETDVLKVNAVQKEVAEESGVYLVDLHDIMHNEYSSAYSSIFRIGSTASLNSTGIGEGCTGDGLHFSNYGSNIVARELVPAVKAVAALEADAVTTVDLVLFAGQSNMAGRGNYTAYANADNVTLSVAEGHGYEYRAISDPYTLHNIAEPFGYSENKTGGVNDGNMKSGSLVSAFVEAYYAQTQRPIVAVSSSKGGSVINEWAQDNTTTNYYSDTVARMQSAKEYLTYSSNYTIKGVYVVWLQGESDGDGGSNATTDTTEYINKLDAIFQGFATDFGAGQCFVISIGNYGNVDATDYEAKNSRYTAIREAQENYCEKIDNNATLISKYMNGVMQQYLRADANDQYYVHLTMPGYKLVGTDAGTNMGKWVNSESFTCEEYTLPATVTMQLPDEITQPESWNAAQSIGSVLVTPTADELNAGSYGTLAGWYYSTGSNPTPQKVTSSTKVQEGMTIYPWFSASSDSYALASGSTSCSGWGYDNTSGCTISTSANASKMITEMVSFNTSAYRQEMVIDGEFTSASGYVRVKVGNVNSSSVTVSNIIDERSTYDVTWTFTNYGTADITLKICIQSSGTTDSTAAFVEDSVTIKAGESAAVSGTNLSLAANANLLCMLRAKAAGAFSLGMYVDWNVHTA